MKARTLHLLFAAHLLLVGGCDTNRSNQDKQAESAPKGKEKKSLFSLIVPTLDDIVRLRAALAAFTLGRVTATASSYKLGYHAPTLYANEGERELDRRFIADFLAGRYEAIPSYKTQFGALLPTASDSAPSAVALARLGFLNVWQFAERYRLLAAPGPLPEAAQQELFQALGACDQYFQAASTQAPDNSVYRGFSADCALLMANGTGDNARLLYGLTNAAEAIQRNPEFNLFTIGYALTFLPADSREFKLGMEMMFRNLDVCFESAINRENPDISSLLTNFQPAGNKVFCINSEKAPHNFEGFFMILGDILVKAGKPAVAKIAYKNAMLLPSWRTWPLKDKLQQRIIAANDLVVPFQAPIDPMVKPNYPTMTFNTEYACMVCHQAK